MPAYVNANFVHIFIFWHLPTKRGNMQNLEGGGKRMFRIAICDDEKIFRDDLKEILIRYMTDRGIMLETFLVPSQKSNSAQVIL